MKFEIKKSNFEEDFDKSTFNSPVDYVKKTAKQKTLEVASLLAADQVRTAIEIEYFYVLNCHGSLNLCAPGIKFKIR